MKNTITEKEKLFDVAIKIVSDYLRSTGDKKANALTYRIAMYINESDNPTLRGVVKIESDFKLEVKNWK